MIARLPLPNLELTWTRQGDLAVILLPAETCLYEARIRLWVEALGRFAEDLHRPAGQSFKGVLLIQASAADDRVETWLNELRLDTLFGELVQGVDTYRWFLSLIRNSPVPWIYMAGSSCLGSFWELALSCQRRYWFAPEAKVGFPEIAAGAFPPGGVLESLSKRTGRTRERWQARPVATAADALDDNLIHVCTPDENWQQRAVATANELIAANPKSGVRDLRRRRSRQPDGESMDLTSRRAAFEQLGLVWRHEQMGSHRDPSAWDYCWRLISERSKLKERGDLGRLICLIASRHLLLNSYQAFVAAHLSRQRALEPPASTTTSVLPAVIDLNYVAPPTSVLLRLLRSQTKLIFVAAEAGDLAATLTLIYGRLERELGAGLSLSLWNRNVSWYQGVLDPTRHVILRWSVDERFLLAWRGSELPFLRLEGNAPTAKPGVLEWPQATLAAGGTDPSRDPRVAPLLAQVCDGIVCTVAPPPLPPLTVVLRSLFLDEMIRISAHADGDLSAVCEALRNSGWRFGGDEEAWDRFLKMRLNAYAAQDLRLGAKAPLAPRNGSSGTSGAGVRELSSWKHAKAMAKRFAGDERRWNPPALSQHFALFLGRLAEVCCAAGRLPHPAGADFLCGAALGLPHTYGTPAAFRASRGLRRVEAYEAAHWPTTTTGEAAAL